MFSIVKTTFKHAFISINFYFQKLNNLFCLKTSLHVVEDLRFFMLFHCLCSYKHQASLPLFFFFLFFVILFFILDINMIYLHNVFIKTRIIFFFWKEKNNIKDKKMHKLK
jgi:hypothetical protein